MAAIPDSVLDSPVGEAPSGRRDLFDNVHNILPSPYRAREEEVMYA